MKIVVLRKSIFSLPEKYRDQSVALDYEAASTNPDGICDADVLFSDSHHVTQPLLEIMKNLKYVQIYSAGYETADTDALRERNITLCNARGVYSVSIAEDIFLKILYLGRQGRRLLQAYMQGIWTPHTKIGPIQNLFGRRVGILGAGSIAQEFAKRAKAFGMHVVAYARHNPQFSDFDDFESTPEGLERLYRESDYIIITLPYTPETYHMVGANEFAFMKKEAIIINIARGNVIDEQALIAALKEKHIGGAGLDVTEEEPLQSDSELWKLDNVIITPHNAWMGDQCQKRLKELFAENLRRYEGSEPLLNVIPL